MNHSKRSYSSIFLAFSGLMVAFLLSHCGSDPAENQIEFPSKALSVLPGKDTTVFGPQGTRIFIPEGAFQFTDGSPATGPITLEIKEFYEKPDMLLADLSTRSGDRMLESGGMVHLAASAEGRELQIRPGQDLVVHFPKDRFEDKDMQLFYADASATDSSVSNWVVDTNSLFKSTLNITNYGWWHPSWDDSTEFTFRPVEQTDDAYSWNPLATYINAYEFSAEAVEDVSTTMNKNTYPKFESWNDYGVELEASVSTKGELTKIKIVTLVSRSTRREIRQFLQGLPKMEPGKNKNGEIIERRGLMFIRKGRDVPMHETKEDYAKSFDQKYRLYEDRPIRNMDDAEVNYYVFSVSKLGWINCDIFWEETDKADIVVDVPVTPSTQLTMSFADIKSMLKAEVRDGKYVFPNVPSGKWVTVMGIRNEEGEFAAAFVKGTTGKDNLQGLEFKETTLGELREKLERL